MAGVAMHDADDRLAVMQSYGRSEIMRRRERIVEARGRVRLQRGGKLGRHDDEIAVDVELVRRGQAAGLLAETERDCHGERRQHMRCLHLTIDETVAQRCPTGVAHKVERDALGLRKAFLPRGNQDGSISETKQGDTDRRHKVPPSRSLAVMSAAATSAIFLPWFMAVVRSSA